MKTVIELKQDRAKCLDDANALMTKAKAENRELTAEEAKSFDELMAQADTLKAEIARREAADQREARLALERANLDSTGDAAGTVNETARVQRVHDRRLDDAARGFQSMGEFGMAVQAAFSPNGGRADERLRLLSAATGMSQGVGADGGFLVPPQFSTQIWDGMSADETNLLNLCDRYTVQGESLTFVANAETSRATGSRFGGVRGYWLAEAEQMTGSKPKVRQVKIEPQQLGVLIYVTDKLLKNSAVALAQYLARAASSEIVFLVNDAILNGDGNGKPKGILASDAKVAVAKESSQAADTIVAENVTKMKARLHPRARTGAVALYNVECEPQFDMLFHPVTNKAGAENVGGYASRMYDAEANTLAGLQLVAVEQCAAIGDVGDVIFANLAYYVAGVRGTIETAMSMHLRFDYNESAFRFLFEVDGQPWNAAPITPYKGSNTLSPFVVLAAR